jgi:hypothetical protein
MGGSEDVDHVPVAMHDADDLDLMNGPVVCVGVRFVQDQVGAFRNHSCGRRDLRPAHAETWMSDKLSHVIFYCGVKTFGSGRIVEADGAVRLIAFLSRCCASLRVAERLRGTAAPLVLPARQCSRR